MGRPCNQRMTFDVNHPLKNTHDLMLKTLLCPFILGGAPPPKCPKLPMVYDEATDAWRRAADTYGAYYLTLFRPFDVYNIDTLEFDWNAFCAFMHEIDPVRRVVDACCLNPASVTVCLATPTQTHAVLSPKQRRPRARLLTVTSGACWWPAGSRSAHHLSQ